MMAGVPVSGLFATLTLCCAACGRSGGETGDAGTPRGGNGTSLVDAGAVTVESRPAKSAPRFVLDHGQRKKSFDVTKPALAADGSLPGYVHDISRTKFRIGAGQFKEVDSPTLERWRGANGAWALDPTTGWSMGILDNTTATGPYLVDEAAHATAVQSYFVSAGLPADQIAYVGSTFDTAGGGLRGADAAAGPSQISINTVLYRAVGGVRVMESFAWAKMRLSGDADMESVYWPTIDANTVASATNFGLVRRICG